MRTSTSMACGLLSLRLRMRSCRPLANSPDVPAWLLGGSARASTSIDFFVVHDPNLRLKLHHPALPSWECWG
jgi:hypothetical protein